MSILNELSSQAGDRSEYCNRRAALRCIEEPALIQVIADGLKTGDPKMQGDCAEVLTQVADNCPDLVAPHAKLLISMLGSPRTRVRWESMHALALVAPCVPRSIAPLLPRLAKLVQEDPSVIVRDYATDAISNYAASSARAAQRAFPYLKQALTTSEGKQAGHALAGLLSVAHLVPKLGPELHELATEYANSKRGVVRRAARRLLKASE